MPQSSYQKERKIDYNDPIHSAIVKEESSRYFLSDRLPESTQSRERKLLYGSVFSKPTPARYKPRGTEFPLVAAPVPTATRRRMEKVSLKLLSGRPFVAAFCNHLPRRPSAPCTGKIVALLNRTHGYRVVNRLVGGRVERCVPSTQRD